MKLLSIDVGIKNLAFCLLRVPDSTQPQPQPKTQTNPKNKPQNNQFEILLWDVVGISQSEQEEAASLQRADSHPVCCHHTHAKDKNKTTTQCKSRAAYFYYSYLDDEPVFTCKRHATETKQIIGMTPPQIAKLLKSGSNDRLLDFCNSIINISISGGDKECDRESEPDPKTKRTNKAELIERATHLLRTSCLFPYEHAHASRVSDTTELLTSGSISKKLTSTLTAEMDPCGADNVSLISVGYNLMQRFDKLFYTETPQGQYYYMPNRVVIENQISPIATRMKTVQGMVTQYFLMRGVSKTNISYISATNKLKAWSAMNADAEIDTYDDRKKTGIACVRTMLSPMPLGELGTTTVTGMTDDDMQRWRTAFESHKKKDDMADSLLQGISCL
jgi:hypothetical protein